MIRTIEEMVRADRFDTPEEFEANLVYMICCGDFMRARRRRFPRYKITEAPESEDDFKVEVPFTTSKIVPFMNLDETTRMRTFYYDHIAYNPTYLMFSNEVEYEDD